MSFYKFKLSSTIPVVQYGNIIPTIEIEGENYEELEKEALQRIKVLWNKYSETPLKEVNKTAFQEITTFTGEAILYNANEHIYLDLEGNRLLSGSQYAKSLEKPFDKAKILPAFAKKNNVTESMVDNMWQDNSTLSKEFGNTIHKLLENWFRYGKEVVYKQPKHPVLLDILTSFLKEFGKYEKTIPEVIVSDIVNHRVGTIDLLVITDEKNKKCKIIDYKTDAQIEKNLKKHFNQLSFYADILIKHGWDVEKLEIWNYTNEWKKYESPILTIK